MLKSRAYEIKRAHLLLSGYIKAERGSREEDEQTGINSALPGLLRELLTFAGISNQEKRKAAIRFIVEELLALLTIGHFGVMFLGLLPVPVLIELHLLKKKIFQRAESFEKDYTALLLSLASGVRTGLDPMTAFCKCAELFSPNSEMKKEIIKINKLIENGLREEQVIRKFAETIRHPDLNLFRTAFILARREGTSLADCLRRLARVTRQRQSFRRKVKAALAMQKLSAIGIAVCTVVIALIQAMGNPEAIKAAIEHPIGSKLLAAGVLSILVGFIWIMTMARSRL